MQQKILRGLIFILSIENNILKKLKYKILVNDFASQIKASEEWILNR